MARERRRWQVLAVLLSLAPAGCFIGYDSRWGQQKQAQQHLAAARTPEALVPGERSRRDADGGTPGSTRTLRVRLEPTAKYAAQVVDCERRFAELLGVVNGVLEPELGIRLEIAETRPFAPPGGEDHIDQLLDRLREADDGADVDWVIGLVGAVPRFEESFHELGMGQVVGKYLVLRALNSAAEYQAIEAGFSELSEADRDRLRRARLTHKSSAVLLHELGHTLGALHEQDATSLMSPRYSKSVHRFSPETLEIMRIVLERRNERGTLDDDAKHALVERWQRGAGPWLPAERADAIARFGVTRSTPAAPPTAVTAALAPSAGQHPAPLASAGLSPADEAAFQQARELLDSGDLDGALRLGKPLFDAYPSSHAVAELRCNIAMRQNLPWLETRRECAGLLHDVPGLR